MSFHDLSFDPRDPLYDAPGLPGFRWGIQVFTTRNLYGLAPGQTWIEADDEGVRLTCAGLAWAGSSSAPPDGWRRALPGGTAR